MNYADITGINWSSLKYMGVSPRMYRHRLTHPEPRKSAWLLGGAIHCAILERIMFDDRYVVLDDEVLSEIAPGRGTKEGKAIVAEHPEMSTAAMTSDEYRDACVALAFPGKTPLTAEQHAVCIAAGDAVREHRVARDLLRGGLAEETVTWTDAVTGLACKGRLDYLRPDLVIDLKSSSDPSPDKFQRSAVSYGYAAQVAFYHDGAMAAKRCTGAKPPHVIAVRTKDDFDVVVFRLNQESFDAGRRIYRGLLRQLAACTAADYWPGMAPELRSLEWPPWAGTGPIEVSTEEGF